MSAAPPKIWTSVELVRWTHGYFRDHGIPSARLDAEVLLAHVLGCERLDLYTKFDRPIEAGERASYRELVRRRATERVPVAYLTQTKEFWSLPLRVTPDVLIPRPDTETLVRAALAAAPGAKRVLDFGTGSGAIAAALAGELPDATLVAVDASAAALDVARANFEALGLAARVESRVADSLAALAGGGFDLVVTNPPYVPSAELETLAPELGHEPRAALDGGSDGLDLIREIAREVGAALSAQPAALLLEVGAGQAPAVSKILAEAGFEDVRAHPDLAGIERVVEGWRNAR